MWVFRVWGLGFGAAFEGLELSCRAVAGTARVQGCRVVELQGCGL